MTQVFLLVKATFSMMEHNFTLFQPLYYTLKRLSNTEKTVSWKPKGLSAKKLLLLPLLIIAFLHQLNGTKIQIFVLYLKGAA